MDWNNFTPLAAALGGALIGAASLMLLLFNGRTAGVSGIAGGVLRFSLRDLDWRLAFLGGLIIAPIGWGLVRDGMPVVEITSSAAILVAGGLLVGFGTRLGSGCTSGHGICGMGRISLRSAVAVVTFLIVGVATSTLARLGGLS